MRNAPAPPVITTRNPATERELVRYEEFPGDQVDAAVDTRGRCAAALHRVDGASHSLGGPAGVAPTERTTPPSATDHPVSPAPRER
jgi:hypothetical protein